MRPLALLLLPMLPASHPAHAQTGEGTASVRLLGQTSIVSTADLEFGTVSVGPGAARWCSPRREPEVSRAGWRAT